MNWFRNTIFYVYWAKFLTWVGDIMLATEPPKVRAVHIRKALALVQEGDIICRKYTYYLDGKFIKGKYTHSGFFETALVDEGMIHAVAEGVCRIDIIDFIKDADGFVILRPPYVDLTQKQKAKDFVKNQIGKPYNFIFTDDPDVNDTDKDNDTSEENSYYCHQLTATTLNEVGLKVSKIKGIYYYESLAEVCTKVYETP